MLIKLMSKLRKFRTILDSETHEYNVRHLENLRSITEQNIAAIKADIGICDGKWITVPETGLQECVPTDKELREIQNE